MGKLGMPEARKSAFWYVERDEGYYKSLIERRKKEREMDTQSEILRREVRDEPGMLEIGRDTL